MLKKNKKLKDAPQRPARANREKPAVGGFRRDQPPLCPVLLVTSRSLQQTYDAKSQSWRR
jgi:hypothetical protein